MLGAYIKRRSNLIFISESQKNIPIEELARCFEESGENLHIFGADCALEMDISENTLKTHIRSLLQKSGYKSTLKLVVDVVDKRLVLPGF